MTAETSFYRNPVSMTPILPTDEKGVLRGLAIDFIKKASSLNNILNAGTREAIAAVVEPMNSYYTNLIEGIRTFPMDMGEVLSKDNLPAEKGLREKQLVAIALVEVGRVLKNKLKEGVDIFTDDFLQMLHREFYTRIPVGFRFSLTKEEKKIEIHPGKIRTGNVYVGKHVAPDGETLDAFLSFFFESYNETTPHDPVMRIVAIAASHHRLAWIHPFVDGNGRVTRLFSEAWLFKEGLGGNGLWSVSRGLARKRKEYYAHLSNADLQRQNNYDGRGNLSDKMLNEFCKFFLETAIDQVEFMNSILNHETLDERLLKLTDKLIHEDKLRKESKSVLQYAFLRGVVSPGKELEKITNKSENVTRKIWKELVHNGWLIVTREEKLRINFPVKSAPFLFPALYPADEEARML